MNKKTVRIGIFGKSSYIGTQFKDYYSDSDENLISMIDSRGVEWKEKGFAGYDVIIHAAGIAHVSSDPKMKGKYFEVNRDLPIIVAQRAKADGVRLFIFFSSMIVFGSDKPISEPYIIDAETEPAPSDFYGQSKLEAERGLACLSSERFHVAILRLPMVYGFGCKGNFLKLTGLATKTPWFPSIENKRSMIYIGNLCVFLRLCIDTNKTGILYPQNTEYVRTRDIIEFVARAHGKNVRFISFLNPLLILLSYRLNLLRKVFSTKIYDKTLSSDILDYNVYSFADSMRSTLKY